MSTYDVEAQRKRLNMKLDIVNKAIEERCKDLYELRDGLLQEIDELNIKGYHVEVPRKNHIKYGESKNFMVSNYGYLELAHKCAKEFSDKVNGTITPIR